MNRKNDVERLLRVNSNQRLPAIKQNYGSAKSSAAQDALYADIKSVLENLRSVLDYVYQDIRGITATISSPPNLYFPFVHPISLAGKQQLPSQIQAAFDQKPLVRELKSQHPGIYQTLQQVQGEQWMSEMFQTVNPQKHDKLDPLGMRIVRSVNGGLTILEGGSATVLPGITLTVDGHRIKGPAYISPGTPIPNEHKQVLFILDKIDAIDFETKWIKRLEHWNAQTEALTATIYACFP